MRGFQSCGDVLVLNLRAGYIGECVYRTVLQ